MVRALPTAAGWALFAMAASDMRERFAKLARQPLQMKLAEIEPFVKAEIVKWARVVKEAGVKVE